MNNSAFAYTITPLDAAETMAFNMDSFGCISWFEYGKMVASPGSTAPVSPDLQPYIRFFKSRRELFRDAAVVADVAVWRSFASEVFADPQHAKLTAAVEQRLIEDRIPFQIVYDQQLSDLKGYRVLVLAGCVALSDDHIRQIQDFVRAGGRLCIIGPVATHDQWMNPRTVNPLAGLPSDNAIYAAPSDDWMSAIGKACGSAMSVSVQGPPGLCMEITAQKNRRLVHLVNYDSSQPAKEITVRLQLPSNKKVRSVVLASPERSADIKLPFTKQGDALLFTVPAVKVYEIAVIHF